nr:TonB family protein [Xenococcaceae cyanobacterium MO_207.B15]
SDRSGLEKPVIAPKQPETSPPETNSPLNPNSDRSGLEKPVIAPKQPETSPPETNSPLNPNSDRQPNSSQPESSEIAGNSSTQGNSENRSAERQSEGENNSSTTENNNSTAANTISDKPKKPLSISCKKNCRPKYPSGLGGAEGRAGIQLTIDANGNVINAAIAESNGNPKLDREALKAARRMKFSSINRDRATVRINISFTVAGSDFERQARREQKERERQEQERIEQLEQEKQAELERERQRQ